MEQEILSCVAVVAAVAHGTFQIAQIVHVLKVDKVYVELGAVVLQSEMVDQRHSVSWTSVCFVRTFGFWMRTNKQLS